MNSLAVGVDKVEGTYTYNATEQRWEYHYVYDLSGYDYDWFMTVQYRDSSGTPQMEASGAATARHTMTGTADYLVSQGGFNLDYNYTYEYDVTLSGLGTGTTVMTGTGGFDLDYTYSGGGSTYPLSCTAK